jgi:hypothetical protein
MCLGLVMDQSLLVVWQSHHWLLCSINLLCTMLHPWFGCKGNGVDVESMGGVWL